MISAECSFPFPTLVNKHRRVGPDFSELPYAIQGNTSLPFTLKNNVLSESLGNDIALREPRNILAAGLLLVAV